MSMMWQRSVQGKSQSLAFGMTDDQMPCGLPAVSALVVVGIGGVPLRLVKESALVKAIFGELVVGL